MAELQDWQQIKQGDAITLSDEQTLLWLVEQGIESTELTTHVKEVYEFVVGDNEMKYTLAKLDTQDDMALVIFEIGDDYDIYVCFNPDIEHGNRQELEFLFDIDGNYVDIIEKDDVEFELKPVLYGETEVYDKVSPASITEYHSTSPCENPNVFIFEYGEDLYESGGYIQLYQGLLVSDNLVRLNFIEG